jgi:hypothetical protein
LHSEENLLIQHIIVQDQDWQNNNSNNVLNVFNEYEYYGGEI